VGERSFNPSKTVTKEILAERLGELESRNINIVVKIPKPHFPALLSNPTALSGALSGTPEIGPEVKL
jgi:hypothetical protein